MTRWPAVLGMIATAGALALSSCLHLVSPKISTLRISDPEGGGTWDVPVKSNGAFSLESRTEDRVRRAEGSIRSLNPAGYAVTLLYERKHYTAPGKFRSQKLESTFNSLANVEVSVGKNPAKAAAEQPAADNGFANVTVMLIRTD